LTRREQDGFRPIDLARLAGISTQQIRNYADEGILPPASRSPSGYRRFGAPHRRALLSYRALERGFGRNSAREIMQAVHADDVPLALVLVDAGHAALHEERLSLRATGEALAAVAEQAPDAAPVQRSGMRIGEVAAYLGVHTSTLRLWESAGLLAPRREPGTRYRTFNPADVRDARMVTMLRQDRYPFPQIRLVLDGLRRTGSSDALRAAIAHRQAELTRRATEMLAAASHLHHYLTGETPD
jgi:DNA-binding transcriptional MerR regulator